MIDIDIDIDNDRFLRRDGIVAQGAHGQTVLLRLSDGSYYALDDVGAAVWDACDGSRTVEGIVTDLCADFDAAPDTVRVDVRQFLGELVAEGLVDRVA